MSKGTIENSPIYFHCHFWYFKLIFSLFYSLNVLREQKPLLDKMHMHSILKEPSYICDCEFSESCLLGTTQACNMPKAKKRGR